MIRNAVLIAGPTASGKSAAALGLARREDRLIVNTDAMQVYDGLRILTARPSAAETAAIPHLLYGYVDPAKSHSVGAWLSDVAGLARSGVFEKTAPIFVGGTGLYFRALCQGLVEMPEIPGEIRDKWRKRLAGEGADALHRVLAERDPAAACRLQPRDGQRIARALEVIDATKRSITAWQTRTSAPLIDDASARKIVVDPDRVALVERIETRFDRMMEEGAQEEASRFCRQIIDLSASASKVIGLRELRAASEGQITLDEAVARAKAATRRYAKRQATWFRHQFGPEWRRVGFCDEIPAESARSRSIHALRVYGP